jgi:hypothetical protein
MFAFGLTAQARAARRNNCDARGSLPLSNYWLNGYASKQPLCLSRELKLHGRKT